MTEQAPVERASLPPPCLRRIERLVEAGAIERQVALGSPRAVGPRVTVIVEIMLEQRAAERQAEFEPRAGAP